MNNLHAGIVSTVSTNIWQFSGPASPQMLAQDLDIARSITKAPATNSFIEIAKMITLAYPYKPEEVLAMPYEEFMIRAAQAEDKLLSLGIITDPITVYTEPEAKAKPVSKPRVDAKKLWEEQQGVTKQKAPTPDRTKRSTPSEKSPVVTQKPSHGIDFTKERRAVENGEVLSGWDIAELPAQRAKMVEDARIIYKDLIEELERKKKEK